ncbi:FAD-binding domain-containing protein [Paracoccus aerius]
MARPAQDAHRPAPARTAPVPASRLAPQRSPRLARGAGGHESRLGCHGPPCPGRGKQGARPAGGLSGPRGCPLWRAPRPAGRPRCDLGPVGRPCGWEISARRLWHRALHAQDSGRGGIEDFLRELAWRDFARDLFDEAPDMARSCWKPDWNRFPWRGDSPDAAAWRQGRTGVAMVDAGMREMYATGRMHNRVRMITASYLVKHLMTDWRIGLDWFARCLTDWDPASNAMNWQWVAGCGPDASPYFRVFNPEGQAAKFDGKRRYQDHWLKPGADGTREFAAAVPRAWGFDPQAPALPAIDLGQGRQRALEAYARFKR